MPQPAATAAVSPATGTPLEAAPSVLHPVARTARIEEMDYVRGLAVLGILLVNMPLYNAHPAVYFNNEATGWFKAWYDQAALWLTRIVAESKFYTLFSFLFGLGFGVQMARATASGVEEYGRFYRRRLAVLLAVGVVHLLLFWWGDVLHVYALVGFLLLLFRKSSQQTLLRWALVILALPAVGAMTFLAVRTLSDTPEKRAERAKSRQEDRIKTYKDIEEQTRTFATGTRYEVQKLRLEQARHHLPREVLWATEVFTMFLLGFWFARSGVLQDMPGNRSRFRRWFWWGLFGGVGTTLVLAGVRLAAGADPPLPLILVVQVLGHVIARPLHALFYATGVVLLVQQQAWRRRLAPLAAVGRMALTNYLTHTIVCVTLFNGVGFGLFGLGLFGRVGPAAGLALVLAIDALQIAFSAWWLARYRFGPMEWAWRSLTYGKPQPMTLA